MYATAKECKDRRRSKGAGGGGVVCLQPLHHSFGLAEELAKALGGSDVV